MCAADGISVTELNQIISDGLRRESRLRNVTVTAEVSGFKHYPSSGHWYFSLKDAAAAIPCVMFRQNNTRFAELRPRDGDRVTVTGSVEMYARDGKVQLYVLSMKAAGIGSLYEQFEALKRKLQGEGLFDQSRKRILPRSPRKVAVITSGSGAAVHDILNVSRLRSPGVPVVLIPSAVQGFSAAEELIRGLRNAARIPDAEVIIIGRGGGSPEDLWCFNDEGLARAIAACPIPVVSGVGHETDFTICDYVADARASTPSNAAELVFPDREEQRGRLRLARHEMIRAMESKLQAARLRTQDTRERLRRFSPENLLRGMTDRTRQSRQLLERTLERRLREAEGALEMTGSRLAAAENRRIQGAEFSLRQSATRLEAISPLNVLNRGYALVYHAAEERVIPEAEAARREEELRIRFRDGTVAVRRKE